MSDPNIDRKRRDAVPVLLTLSSDVPHVAGTPAKLWFVQNGRKSAERACVKGIVTRISRNSFLAGSVKRCRYSGPRYTEPDPSIARGRK